LCKKTNPNGLRKINIIQDKLFYHTYTLLSSISTLIIIIIISKSALELEFLVLSVHLFGAQQFSDGGVHAYSNEPH